MASWAWILIAVAIIIIVVGLLAARAMRRQRSATRLRGRFGPEYDRVLYERKDRRAAEADLSDRVKQRERLDIRPLTEPTRARFAAEWREVQERFVDQPPEAVVAADALVSRVLSERGYPMDSFEALVKLISVDHPAVVDNYRFARAVCERAQSQQVSTEDLRAALLHYRSLFDALLQSEDDHRHSEADRRAGGASGRPRGTSGSEESRQQSTQ